MTSELGKPSSRLISLDEATIEPAVIGTAVPRREKRTAPEADLEPGSPEATVDRAAHSSVVSVPADSQPGAPAWAGSAPARGEQTSAANRAARTSRGELMKWISF